MLLELRDRLRSTGPQSVAELQAGLGLSEPVVRDMLERWMAKGRVVRLDAASGCTRCARQGRCSGSAGGCFELYRWVEAAGATPPSAAAST
jgi:hypothetical protein